MPDKAPPIMTAAEHIRNAEWWIADAKQSDDDHDWEQAAVAAQIAQAHATVGLAMATRDAAPDPFAFDEADAREVIAEQKWDAEHELEPYRI